MYIHVGEYLLTSRTQSEVEWWNHVIIFVKKSVGEQKTSKTYRNFKGTKPPTPKKLQDDQHPGSPTAYWGPWVVGSILLRNARWKGDGLFMKIPMAGRGVLSKESWKVRLRSIGKGKFHAGQVNFNMLEDFFGVYTQKSLGATVQTWETLHADRQWTPNPSSDGWISDKKLLEPLVALG